MERDHPESGGLAGGDPPEDWAHWISRYRRQQRVGLIAGLPSMLYMMLMVVGGWFGGASTWTMSVLAALGGIAALGSVFVTWMLVRRSRRVLALVPAHDGLVCLKCLRTDLSLQGELLRCPRCSLGATAAQWREWWAQSVISPMWVAQSVRAARSGLDPAIGAASLPPHLAIGLATTAVLTLVGVALILAASLPVTGVVLTMILVTLVVLVGLAGGAAWFVRAQRRAARENRVVCASCGYRFTPADAARASPQRCPECGAPWHQPARLVRGLRIDPRLRSAGVVTGVLLGLLCFGWQAIVQIRAWRSAPDLDALIAQIATAPPTPPLIPASSPGSPPSQSSWQPWLASAPNSAAAVAWNQLSIRMHTLSGGQRDRFADAVLDRFERSGCLELELRDELWAILGQGRLSAEDSRRLVASVVAVSLVAPTEATAGDTVEIHVRTRSTLSPGVRPLVRMTFGGIQLGDDEPPIGRAVHAAPLVAPSPWQGVARGGLGASPPNPGAHDPITVVLPATPGRLRVRAEVWLSADDGGRRPLPIAWTEDGPELPANTIWSVRQIIEAAIDVRPRAASK